MGKAFKLRSGLLLLSTEAPGGVYNSAQLKKIAGLCDGEAALAKATEDQRLALFVAPEKAAKVAAELKAVGLGVRHYQDGLHQPVNCLGELCGEHLQDAMGASMDLSRELAGVTLDSPLKIGINGCARCCVATHTLDISIIGDSGGYRVSLGGKNSQLPEMASFMAEGVPAGKLPKLIAKVVAIYRELAGKDESLQEVMERAGSKHFVEALAPYSQDAAHDDPFAGIGGDASAPAAGGPEIGGDLELGGDDAGPTPDLAGLEAEAGEEGLGELTLDEDAVPQDLSLDETAAGDELTLDEADAAGNDDSSLGGGAGAGAGDELSLDEIDAAGNDDSSLGAGAGDELSLDDAGELSLDDAGEPSLDETSGELSLDETSGERSLDETAGELSLDETGGELSLDETSGERSLDETAGELSLDETGGELSLDETGGELSLGETAGELSLDETAGELSLDETAGELALARTGGGDEPTLDGRGQADDVASLDEAGDVDLSEDGSLGAGVDELALDDVSEELTLETEGDADTMTAQLVEDDPDLAEESLAAVQPTPAPRAIPKAAPVAVAKAAPAEEALADGEDLAADEIDESEADAFEQKLNDSIAEEASLGEVEDVNEGARLEAMQLVESGLEAPVDDTAPADDDFAAVTDDAVADGAQADDAQADGAQADDAQADDAITDDAITDDAISDDALLDEAEDVPVVPRTAPTAARSATPAPAAGPMRGATPTPAASPTRAATPAPAASPTRAATPTPAASPTRAAMSAPAAAPLPARAPAPVAVRPAQAAGGFELAGLDVTADGRVLLQFTSGAEMTLDSRILGGQSRRELRLAGKTIVITPAKGGINIEVDGLALFLPRSAA